MNTARDAELFLSMKRKLYSAAICDTLDDLGYRNQAMRENIRPLDPGDGGPIVGRAKTLLSVDVYAIPDNPYDAEIDAIDSIRPGEVVVACTNGSVRNGLWGELLSTASKMRGAAGAIIDGFVRDTRKIAELGFPVYCTGIKPVDSKGRGKVIDFDCPIEAGDVLVHPGDVVFADADGVVVIPSQLLEATVEAALRKVERENHTRDELFQGKLLREVYDKYGVL